MLLIHSYLLKEVPLECCSSWYFWYQLGIFEAKKGQKYQMVFLPRLTTGMVKNVWADEKFYGEPL